MSSGFHQLWVEPLLILPWRNRLSNSKPEPLPILMGTTGLRFWGPTLIMNKGDAVKLNVTNNLSEATTTHWHGFHIPAIMDGGPHQLIEAGTTWSPTFEIKNNAGTYWYHPHLHEKTKEHLTYGAGGLIIIKDPIESALALPQHLWRRRYPADSDKPELYIHQCLRSV